MKNHAKNATRYIGTACFLLLCLLSVGGMTGHVPYATATESEQTAPCVGEYAEAGKSVGGEARAVIVVKAEGRVFTYRDDLLAAPDHTVYEQLERRNINAPLPEKMRTVDKCLAAGAQWREAIRYAFPLLPAFVEKIEREIDLPPRDSEIVFTPSTRPMFRITRAQNGRQVDEKRLYQDIYLALRKGPRADITVKPLLIAPQVTAEDNVKLTHKISTFSTSFASSAEGRKNNIRLALKKLNGAVILPHEEFSFNGRVGARTKQNGFSTAKIIVSGEYTEGVGGGVCQASTTLYNAALAAGMRVTAVRNHSILPSYVPASLDAMVNSSSSDLKFVNPYDTPVFVHAECVDDSARITFYGAALPYVIKPVSRVLGRTQAPPDREILDTERKFATPETPAGTRIRVAYGHAGVTSEACLRYFDKRSGALLREEKIRTDIYNAVAGLVAVVPEAAQ